MAAAEGTPSSDDGTARYDGTSIMVLVDDEEGLAHDGRVPESEYNLHCTP
eukprot:gene2031-24956_t